MEMKWIPINKIVVEDIDPFLGKDQVIETTYFDEIGVAVIFYYHDKDDCLMVRLEQDSKLMFEEKASRLSYNGWVSTLKKSFTARS